MRVIVVPCAYQLILFGHRAVNFYYIGTYKINRFTYETNPPRVLINHVANRTQLPPAVKDLFSIYAAKCTIHSNIATTTIVDGASRSHAPNTPDSNRALVLGEIK
jgi:hypothetical protein